MADVQSTWETPEITEVRKTIRRFLVEEVVPRDEEFRRNHCIDRAVWTKAADLGLIGMSIPEKFGGLGLDFLYEVAFIEEQTRLCNTSFPFVPGALNAPAFFIETATEEQARLWGPRIVSGEAIISVGITEPGIGSDVKALRTKARREGDRYIINGTKTFMTLGRTSDICLVAARTGGEGAKGISLLLVEKAKAPGFKVSKVLEKVGQDGLDTCEVFLDDVEVPVENLVGGEEGRGFGQLMDVFNRERLSIAVRSVVAAETAVKLTVEHARDREMFGQTLWDFQNSRMVLAECATEARVMRVFIDDILLRMSKGEQLSPNDAVMAKWWCSEKQCEIVDRCLQLFGGYGYMAEYPIAQLYKDARVEKIYGGSNEVLKELVARRL
ncbi:MAG: acyl-CoA dehydrogenase [Phyllobacteriaceae bacterium]|nr:acyl-CoA dehydrogenase [Phyllobacteriaceae bacterium]MBA91924.1 acyl-CoA dehydrogenase [Phyllobacteriaceae bacterium]